MTAKTNFVLVKFNWSFTQYLDDEIRYTKLPFFVSGRLRPAAAGVAKLAARDSQLRVQMLLF